MMCYSLCSAHLDCHMGLLNVQQEMQLVAQHRPTAHALSLRQLGPQQARCMDPCLGTLQRQRMAITYNILLYATHAEDHTGHAAG